MAVHFSGINKSPEVAGVKASTPRKVAFTAAQKADTVSFGNAAALSKAAPAAKNVIKKAVECVVKNVKVVKNMAVKILQVIVKPLKFILSKEKSKG